MRSFFPRTTQKGFHGKSKDVSVSSWNCSSLTSTLLRVHRLSVWHPRGHLTDCQLIVFYESWHPIALWEVWFKRVKEREKSESQISYPHTYSVTLTRSIHAFNIWSGASISFIQMTCKTVATFSVEQKQFLQSQMRQDIKRKRTIEKKERLWRIPEGSTKWANFQLFSKWRLHPSILFYLCLL